MTLLEIYEQAWVEWMEYQDEYQKAIDENRAVKTKMLKKDPDQDRILRELGLDEHLD